MDLHILFWNVTGLRGKFYGNTHSGNIFLEFISKFTIIGLAETWATNRDNFILQGFQSFSAIRKQNRNIAKNSGGIIVYIREEFFNISKELKSSSDNVVWVLFQCTKQGWEHDLIVGTVYLSPENSSIHAHEDTLNVIENEIVGFRNQYESIKVILMGDFNGYTATQPDYLVDRSGNYDCFHADDEPPEPRDRSNKDARNPNNYGRNLLNLCIMSNLYIVNGRVGKDRNVGEYTCYFGDTPSTIDYFLADRDLFTFFKDFHIDVRDESHHMPLCLNLSLPVETFSKTEQTCDIVENLPRYNWIESKRQLFLNSFSTKNIETVRDLVLENDPANAIICLNNYICEAAADMKTNRVRKRYRNPGRNEAWFDKECELLRRNTIRAIRDYRKMRNVNNLMLFKDLKRKLSAVYREKKRIYQEFQMGKLRNLLDSKDSKTFWSTVKAMQKQKRVSYNNIECNKWYNHFKNLFNPPNQASEEFRRDLDYNVNLEELDMGISVNEVVHAINGLKNGKAPGTDGISAEFYKAILPNVATIIKDLFNKIYELSYFPDIWCESLIITIHKRGRTDVPDNYRGISLLNVLSKAFTTILNSRITKWLECNSLLCKEQGGFRKKFSTTDSIFTLNTLIEKYTNRPRGRFYCAFVDFTKAFDTINREALWVKLQNIGISTKMLKILMAIYDGVEASVLTTQGQSQKFSCPMGVKQGCILSPTLFSIYINDLPSFFLNANVYQIPLVDLELSSLLYADDLVLASESSIGLQRQLNLLKSYCDKWHLKVNKEKTKIMVFRRGGVLRSYEKWFYGDEKIAATAHFSYLGVYFSSFHHWGYNQKFRADKGLRAMGSLNRMMLTIPNISSDLTLKVFDTRIIPILHYGSEVWGYSDSQCIERVQLKCCKNIMKIHSRVPGIAVRGEMGRLPLSINRRYNLINYWLRLLRIDSSRLTKDAYKLQLIWTERDKECWLKYIKNMLFNYGFAEAWFNQGLGDAATFKTLLKTRMNDIGIQSWETEVNNMDRLRHYKVIKHRFSKEAYIDKLEPKDRSVVANFRCTGLPLKTLVGVYYEKLNYEACICEICDKREIEHEYHFLLVCPTLSSLRKKYISEYYWNQPTLNKYNNLLNRSDYRGLYMVVKYLHEALKLRDEMKESRTSILQQPV